MGHFPGTHGWVWWVPSRAAQHTSLAAPFLSTPPVPSFPMWQKADRRLLTPIKDSKRHFIDEWVIDAYLLASWGELLWCRILYSSRSSLEKVSSLPFGSVLRSICYVSCRLWLISVEGSDSYVGFTHDSSRQRLRSGLNPQLCSSWYQRAFIFNKSQTLTITEDRKVQKIQ